MLSLLNGSQHALLTRLSHPLMRESTDSQTYSEGENKVNWKKDTLDYISKLQRCKSPTSKRLLEMFHLGKLRECN